jgi:hypothetical protein
VPARDARPDEERPSKDADLVQALRAGDPEAPAALWARYSPSVGRVLAKALGPTIEIEDLKQEVFLRVFRRLPSLRDPSALRAFVLAEAGVVISAGLIMGALVGWALSRMLVQVLNGVFDPPPDALAVPWGYLAATVAVTVAAIVAACVWFASRVTARTSAADLRSV